MKHLHVSPDLSLPANAVTETFGILAVRGAGKSNAAVVMAESMFETGHPFVAIDPKGDWWGLRAEGTTAGLPIPIFGGDHGDVPLEPGGGAYLAELIAEQRLSCVLDVSEFSEGEKTRFLIDFGATLLRKNRNPLHLFLEEADDYIPQRPFREQARCVGVFQKLVKRGRFHGLGCTVITQRSAAINKDVLYMVETMFIMRTVGPKDRDTVEGWIEHQGGSKEILGTLPSLKSGEAWVYSPTFLGLTAPKRIRFHQRTTFDSGKTPEVGEKARAPSTLADVDLGVIREKMAATIERAKAEDPRALKARIAELEKAARAVPAAPPAERVEVPVLKDTDLLVLQKAIENIDRVVGALKVTAEELSRFGHDLIAAISRAARAGSGQKSVDRWKSHDPEPRPEPARFTIPRRPAKLEVAHFDGDLPPARQRLLDALAWLEAIGRDHGERTQVAFLAGQSPKSSSYEVNLSALRQAGLVLYQGRGEVRLTDAGREAARAPDRIPTAEDLHATLRAKLSDPQWRILSHVIRVYPQALARQALADLAGVSATSSSYEVNLSWLRNLGVITYSGKGEVSGTPVLFLEGGR